MVAVMFRLYLSAHPLNIHLHSQWNVLCRDRIGIAMVVLGLWSVVTFIMGLLAFVLTTFSLWKVARNW